MAHLPRAAEVARQHPNPYGYGTGVEDCMISAGVMAQMQDSLELLESLEQDAESKKQMREIMAMVSQRCTARAIQADRNAQKLDLTILCTDWRTGEGLSMKGAYRPVWYNIRESGEAALAQLMVPAGTFPPDQQLPLARAVTHLDYSRVSSGGIFYLQAAHWKVRRHGMYETKEAR